MNENYITISKFSKKAGVSTQSIYKRISKKDNAIHKYLKVTNEGAKISSLALKELYGITENEEVAKVGNEVVQPNKNITEDKKEIVLNNDSENPYKKIIDILQKQVDNYYQEIQTKDSLIKDLTDTIKQNQVLIDQQQKLALADKQKILQLEEQTAEKKRKKFLGIF